MSKKYIFNSSMPRSGSELMQCILHQNPDIYGSATSPVLEYWFGARRNRNTPEAQSQPQALMDKAFLGFCRAGIDGYYDQLTDRPVVCDKSRGWAFYYRMLEQVLEEKPKMICMVRDLRDIFASMENIFRKTRHMPAGPDNPQEMRNITVEGRVQHWENTQPIGLGLQRLYDAKAQGFLKDIHVVRYEDLTANPKETMEGVYKYLELPSYDHNFDNVTKEVLENDQVYGVYGDHSIKNKVEVNPSSHMEVLGLDVSNYIVNKHRWYYDVFY